MKSRLLYVVGSFVACLAMAGCPSLWTVEPPSKELSAADLYKEAEQRLEKKEYPQAVEAYQQLKSAHPDFDKMARVYVRIADALYANREYEKAISRYLQFLELYPTHAFVPRVKYYIAMSYFNQIKNTDLDNAILQKSSESFRSLAADTKAGEWATKAKERYEECRKKLAEKEMYKARTYVSMGNYTAARVAAQRVIEQYPKLGFDEEAQEVIKKAKDKQ